MAVNVLLIQGPTDWSSLSKVVIPFRKQSKLFRCGVSPMASRVAMKLGLSSQSSVAWCDLNCMRQRYET